MSTKGCWRCHYGIKNGVLCWDCLSMLLIGAATVIFTQAVSAILGKIL